MLLSINIYGKRQNYAFNLIIKILSIKFIVVKTIFS